MHRYQCICPADSLLSREKYDNECQHGEPMCWENNHIHHTALKHKHITKYMPVAHALTECDPASYRFRIGKATALKVLMGGHHLIKLDQHGADEDKLASKATVPSLLHVTDQKLKYT